MIFEWIKRDGRNLLRMWESNRNGKTTIIGDIYLTDKEFKQLRKLIN